MAAKLSGSSFDKQRKYDEAFKAEALRLPSDNVSFISITKPRSPIFAAISPLKSRTTALRQQLRH